MPLPLPESPTQRKRLKEWKNWLKNFKQDQLHKGKEIHYIPNAAWLLNDLYWRLAEQYLRPVLETPNEEEEEHRIHPYKIISASEITIMMTEPIEAESNDEKTKYAAMLAWFVATQIMEGWNTGNNHVVKAEHINKVAGYKEFIDDSERYPESFAAEHIKWLAVLNVTIEKPLLINAQCWRMFYLTCLAIASRGKLK
jgi:hypothetical protein